RIKIIRAVVPGLYDKGEIRRKRAAVCRAGGFFVRERRLEIIRRLAGAFHRLPYIINRWIAVAGGQRLDLAFRETDILQRTERDALQTVARRADLLVDLKAALGRLFIYLAHGAVERPVLLLGMLCLRQRKRRRGKQEDYQTKYSHYFAPFST